VETDALAARGGMTWSPSDEVAAATIRDIDGVDIVVRDLDLVWWRRLTGEPRLPDSLDDEAARDLVTRDCRATLVGLMLTEFRGRWISHPEATRLAENKLVQLQAARRAGLSLPRTLISQTPEIVRRFCRELEFRVVVKTVAGTPKTPIMTGALRPEMLVSDAAISVSPAIYQELLPGTRHLRVCCFGDELHAALLETEQLDWRYPLDATAEPYEVDEPLAARLRAVLLALNLKMGIFDLKLRDDDGEPVWLEVNPQGQFLFLEEMCGLPLTDAFADFLTRESERAAT
jgi:glutathione synthase/RimK-type ligase-like ATP-grasp enzyme